MAWVMSCNCDWAFHAARVAVGGAIDALLFSSVMACLDDPTVLRFVTGRLDELAHRKVEEEVGRCRRCAALVAELIRDRPAPRRDSTANGSSPSSNAGEDGDDREHDRREDSGEGEVDPRARYVLGKVIARGGMGTIQAAFDRQLDRAVAIKRLDSDRPELAIRFAREIRVTASLQHPGIVPIYDSGLLPDGHPFFAMRHVPGASLEQEIAGRRSHSERMALLVPVLAAAEAVAYAHERGVVHRDLKPSNILVGPFGETVVIDWGLARTRSTPAVESAGSPVDGDPIMTLHGTVLGTPRYMSPEQARGEPASFPSDVHALGAILYHGLAGSPPVVATEVKAVLEQVARSEVAPLAQVVPGLPGDLTAIVDRAMAPAPEERYSTAGELAADLRRFQTGQLVAAHDYSRRDLMRRFLRRHRAAVTLAALCAAAIAVVAVVSFQRILSEREHAEQERLFAERERAGAEDLVQFLVYDLRRKLRTVGRLDVLSGVADRVESYYLTTASGRAELPATLRARAELDDLRAEVANSAGDGAAADRHLRRGLALIERAPATPRADEVRAALLASMGLRAARRAELERARALFLESVRVRRAIRATDPAQRRRNDLELTGTLKRAAVLAERMGAPSDAEREWKEAASILEGYRARDGGVDAAAGLGEIQLARGQNRFRRGDLDGAQEFLDLALAAGTATTAREPRNTQFQSLLTWSCLSLADLAGARGQLDAAQRLSERAGESARLIAAIEPASATWQSALGRAEMNLGGFALERKDTASAVEHLRSAQKAYEALVARDPSDNEIRRAAAVSIAQLAEAETGLRDTDEARESWRASLSHFARLAGSGSAKSRMEWANGLRLYAAFERSAGRSAPADDAVDKAMSLLESTPAMVETPSEISYRAGVLLEAGRAHAAHRRPRDARRAWERAAAILRARAKQAPLETDSVKVLRAIESELAGGSRRARGQDRP